MIPLYIFDLDGTISLTAHRQHILDDKTDPQRWDKFYKACVDDAPNEPVITTMRILADVADIYIWSGREDSVMHETLSWLVDFAGLSPEKAPLILRMRPKGDYTPDDVLKQKWYYELSPIDRARLIAVFDDRQKVVEMWRASGVACFQVAPGDF